MPTTKRLGGEISIPFWKRLRIASIEQDKTLNALLEQVIEAGLNAVNAPVTPASAQRPIVPAMNTLTRARDYSGPTTQVGAQINRDLWTSVRGYCISRSIPLRYFMTDAIRKHLRLVQRGEP